jgi:hypothetical protein
MNTLRNPTLICALLAITVATSGSPVAAYPPDNAAVLYYKAFMLYEAKDEIKSALDDYRQRRIALNKTIEEYLAKNRRVIDIVLDAARIEHCDWGLDYSQGTEVLLPPHYEVRDILFLIAAEAAMQADKGDYRKALERCLAMYRMARHVNERPLICYLVGTGVNAVTHKCVTRFLGEMAPDVETLTWLRAELVELDKQPFSVKSSLDWKREAGVVSMSPAMIGGAVEMGIDDGEFRTEVLERIRTADAAFFARNVAYWNDFMDDIQAAFKLTYAQARAELQRLDKKPCEEFDRNTDATLTSCFAPAFLRIHGLSVRLETQSNAVGTALDLYLAKARTGRLPDALPADAPRDAFSGKPFEYVRTATGFVLRCRSKDLDKDKAYEYEFIVKE